MSVGNKYFRNLRGKYDLCPRIPKMLHGITLKATHKCEEIDQCSMLPSCSLWDKNIKEYRLIFRIEMNSSIFKRTI